MLKLNARVITICIFSFICLAFLLSAVCVYAQVPATETAGAIEEQRRQAEKMKTMEQKIKTQKEAPVTQEKAEEKKALPPGEKVLINKIVVEGVTLISEADVKKVTSKYEGKELTLLEMQKVADEITALYRNQGYATSRAYLPPQTIAKEGILTIRVVEGKVGEVTIKGNKWFKTALLKKKLKLKPDTSFDYASLQKSLVKINEHPDRHAKAVLVPGKTAGTTDIVVEVKDKLPIHARYEHDNYASRFVGQTRDSAVFEDNNVLGFDDKLYYKYQLSEDSLYLMHNARYLFPATDTLDIGASWLYSRQRLGRDFEALGSIGDTMIWGMFLNKGIVSRNDIDMRLNFGFDYKQIHNHLLGEEVSRDDVRVIKTGLDFDVTDAFGRTLFTPELDVGIPRMWGGWLQETLVLLVV
jgi:hemolysin activation/secretion protein